MKFEDLTGMRFGRLTVYERTSDYVTPKGQHSIRWLCICDCGKEKIAKSCDLKKGSVKSCGCLKKDCQSWLPGNPQNVMCRQRKISKNNTSGMTGVYWHERHQRWRARIKHKGKEIYLGEYKNKADAIKARKYAEERIDKEMRGETT